MNLYGVASIKLDKMRGTTIKKTIRVAFVVYFLVLVISMMLPARLVTFNLGDAEVLTSPGESTILRFRKTFKLSDTKLNDFEIVANKLTGTEINFGDAHKKLMSYFEDHKVKMNVRWFETNSEITKN